MKNLIITLVLFACSCCIHAQTFNLKTVPASDGYVMDKNNDKIADQAVAAEADASNPNQVLSIRNSFDGKALSKAVFEFKIPEKLQNKNVGKAIFSVCLNWAFDSEKKQKGRGPELELWGYYDKYADGKISLNDFKTGKSLNITVKRDHTLKKQRYLELDVSTFVKEALKKQAKYIAFRLDPKPEGKDMKMWTWRSSEFGLKYGNVYTPTLKIICGKVNAAATAATPSSQKKKITKPICKPGTDTATYTIYPESGHDNVNGNLGVLNARRPFLLPEPGGALNSKAINVQQLLFTYDISKLMDFKSKVDIDFYLRQSRYPGERTVIELIGTNGTMALTESQYAETRWLTLSYGRNKTKLVLPYDPEWKKHRISIDQGQVIFDGKALLKIDRNFSPITLKCMAYSVDQLAIKEKNCELSLNWEKDYTAKIKTKYQNEKPFIKTFGFDTMVISLDPAKRDCPFVVLYNNTDKPESIKIDYELHSEVNKLKENYSQTIKLPPRSWQETAIKLPANLKTDIYHLKIKSGKFSQYKHFMYAKRRAEKPGEMKFGIHDSNEKKYGYYPEALPMRYAHKYLRWWTESYPWLRNPDKTWGLRKDAKPDQWVWNTRIDAIVRQPGLIPFVCVQGGPTIDYQRVREVGHMRKLAWGKLGGETDLKRYGKYLEQVIKRYKGKVRLWEVENEPNTGTHLGNRPAEYVGLAKTVYTVIKKHDPQSTILGISGTSKWPEWMQTVFKLGGDKYMDRVSYHSYFGNAQPTLLLDFLDDAVKKMPERFHNRTFNSETGMLQALRIEVDKPLSQEYVDRQNKLKHPAFVSKAAWPGKCHSEYDAGRGMVKNAVINFLAGAKAFTFFGWTTSWPKGNINTTKTPGFNVFSISAKNERTPSQYTLALAVLTTQFEGVTLKKDDYKRVRNYGVTGGVFSKADGGKMAVVWGNQQKSTCVFETNQPRLEVVNMYGQTKLVDLNKASNGKYVYTLSLGNAPVYVHSRGDITVLPSPIEGCISANTAQNAGTLTIKLLNSTDKPAKYTLVAPTGSNLKFVEKSRQVTIPPKMRGEATFHWQLLHRSKNHIFTPFKITNANNTYEVEFTVRLKKFQRSKKTNLNAKAYEQCDIRKFPAGMAIDTVEQAVLGAPPVTESIQQAGYWQGSNELSGKAAITHNDQGIIIGIKVKDSHMVMPGTWPTIHGACVEIFFDFRDKNKGLGNAEYGRGVFQFLATPKNGCKLFCPQIKSLEESGIRSYSKKLDKEHYYIGMFIPWSFVKKYGSKHDFIGFDIGIDGADPKDGKRKTQLMLFGNSNNSQNASNFGIIHLAK